MSGKEGLHGWQAFFVVVGSGLLAAFLVVGIVVGLVRILVPSSESPGPVGQAGESRQPRETVAPGVLDLCELVESQSLMSASSFNRIDSGDSYSDSADPQNGSESRTVVDDCSWEVVGSASSLWNFNLSYTAFMEDSETSSKEDLAKVEFDRRVQLSGESFPVESSENFSPTGNSWNSYGRSSEEADQYAMVKIVKSGVFEVFLSGPDSSENPQLISEQEFRVEVQKLAPYLEQAFVSQIPD